MQEKIFLENNIIFDLISEAIGQPLDLIDRMWIAQDEHTRSFSLCMPNDMVILKPLDFFKKNQYKYHLVQFGEFLSFSHIDPDKPFIAYTRENVGTCQLNGLQLKEVLAYKPK